MPADASVRLDDGRSLDVRVHRYPLAWADQATTIDLWRTEWEETGFDWLPWLNGVYANDLVTETAVMWDGDAAVATATVCYPAQQPETCAVMNVVTRKSHRGLGIAHRLTDLIVDRAFHAGCTSAYLGNTPTPHSAYEKCGFVRMVGVFMRRARGDTPDPEALFFASGQRTAVRPSNWGDIPGVAALAAHPLETLVLDYPRGLISAKHLPPERGVTHFPAVWYGSRRAGGDMHVVHGGTPHRVLGFGSFTPGSGSAKNWLADVDFVCHDSYRGEGPTLLRSLINAAKARPYVKELRLRTANADEWKRRCARECGFGEPKEDSESLRVCNGKVSLLVQQLALERK